MNFVGHPAVFLTRYDGTPLDLIGSPNASGKVALGGFLHAFDGTLDIGEDGEDGDLLRLDGGGLITSNCSFGGVGELRGGGSSSLLQE